MADMKTPRNIIVQRGVSILFRSHHFHLAMLAIEFQTETLAITTHQVIRLPERGFLLVANRTPAHAIAQAMLAEHQYGIIGRALLEGRGNACDSMIAIE